MQFRVLTILKKAAFENIAEKEEILMTSILSFLHNILYSFKARNHRQI